MILTTVKERAGIARIADRLLWQSLAALGVRGCEVAAKFALYILAARLLGERQSGLLFLALTWGHCAATGGRLGVERALTRLLAAELAVQQGRRAKRVLIKGIAVTAASGLVVGTATALAAPLVAQRFFHDPDALAPLRASALTIPGLTVAFTLASALAGLGRTVMAQVLQNLMWPLGLLAGLAAGLRSPSALVGAMAATLVLAVALAILSILRDRRRLSTDLPLAGDVQALPSLAATAGPLYVVELAQVTIASLPVLLLGAYADASAVGLFSLASRASMLVWVVLISLGTVVSPQFAGLHRRRAWDELARLTRRTQTAGAVLGGAVCLALSLAGRPLMAVAGPGFAVAVPALIVLAAGQMVNALYATQDVLLAMTGQGAVLRLLSLAQLAVLVVLSLALIPPFGLVGAALATALVTAQGGLGTAAAVRALLPRAAPFLAPPLPGWARWRLRGLA